LGLYTTNIVNLHHILIYVMWYSIMWSMSCAISSSLGGVTAISSNKYITVKFLKAKNKAHQYVKEYLMHQIMWK